jgi:hypothetical protein
MEVKEIYNNVYKSKLNKSIQIIFQASKRYLQVLFVLNLRKTILFMQLLRARKEKVGR